MEFHQSMVIGTSGIAGQGEIADDGWSTSIPQVSKTTCQLPPKIKKLSSQDLPMQNVLRDIPSSAALTPEPVMDAWEEHQHLMNPMFLQSPDEIDLPPLDPELLEHRRHQVRVIHDVVTISKDFLRSVKISLESVTEITFLVDNKCLESHLLSLSQNP